MDKKSGGYFFQRNGLFIALGIIFFSLLISIAGREIYMRLSYELHEVYTADNSLYFAVGKGMLHGYAPYRDLYENKPPMVFLLSAISYALTGNFYLVNIICFVNIIILIVLPLVFLWKNKTDSSLLTTLLLAFAILTISLLLALYGEARSGEGQVELYGATCLVIYFFLALSTKKEAKFYHPMIVFSGIFLGIAVMFKEPFAIIALVGALLLFNDKKTFLKRVIWPGIYGIVTALVILLVSRSLPYYFTIYLKTMFSNYVDGGESFAVAAFNVKRIIADLGSYSLLLPALIALVYFYNIARVIINLIKKPNLPTVINLLGLFLLPFIASYSVSIGGHLYNHHFVTPLPLYALIILYSLTFKTFPYVAKSMTASELQFEGLFSLLLVSLGISSFAGNSVFNYYQATIENTIIMKQKARYLDEVLDSLNVDRFLYIGFNGFTPYAYSTHDPLGPSFAQDPNNFKGEENYFVTGFFDALFETEVIVYSRNTLGVYYAEAMNYIYANFTTSSPSEILLLDRPSSFNETLFFRQI
ncbi:MAG TPA: hypothetical protein PKC96_06630 [Bacilli bacterium]|nr:hypothetical protein [Bacilli bacterium]